MMKKALIVLGMGLSTIATATILPPNDLNLEDNIHNKAANLTQTRFLELSNTVIDYYRPIVEAHGASLSLNANWQDSTVNASAQQIGSTWVVNMYGGLARRPEVTEDGYVLVVCHELGHHLAGFPQKSFSWAATEGQSDYFATQACARNVWGNDIDLNATFRSTASQNAITECDAAWQAEADQNLCYRAYAAGFSLADLLGTASDSNRDSRVVTSTNPNHPAAQCRFDTYRAGALCDIDFVTSDIPTTRSAANAVSCTRANGYTLAAKPTCWYKP